jgi:hypothetical protein
LAEPVSGHFHKCVRLASPFRDENDAAADEGNAVDVEDALQVVHRELGQNLRIVDQLQNNILT